MTRGIATAAGGMAMALVVVALVPCEASATAVGAAWHAQTTVPFSRSISPSEIAVAPSGAVWVASGSDLIESSAGGGVDIPFPLVGDQWLSALAVGSANDLFVGWGNEFLGSLGELPAGATDTSELTTFLSLDGPLEALGVSGGQLTAIWGNAIERRPADATPGSGDVEYPVTIPGTALAIAADGRAYVAWGVSPQMLTEGFSPEPASLWVTGPSNFGTYSSLPFPTLHYVPSIAVDPAGDVFAADVDGDSTTIYELRAGDLNGLDVTTLPFTGLSQRVSLATDAAGDVFAADETNGRVVELTPKVWTTLQDLVLTWGSDDKLTASATVSPVPDGGTIDFAISPGCASVPVDPTTGSASCTIDVPPEGLPPLTFDVDYSGTDRYAAASATETRSAISYYPPRVSAPMVSVSAPLPSPPAQSGVAGTSTTRASAVATVHATRVHVGKKVAVRLVVTCPAAAPSRCVMAVKAVSNGSSQLTLGHTALIVASGRSVAHTFILDATAQRLVRQHHRVAASIHISEGGSASSMHALTTLVLFLGA